MTTLVALTVGLVAWIVLWAIGAKPFDAFLVTLLILLPAAAWQIFSPGIKKMLGQSPPPSSTR
jgi:divalent metal cation (Fe/Co/Zn/Cd) transporter